jgi:hypothetical protein
MKIFGAITLFISLSSISAFTTNSVGRVPVSLAATATATEKKTSMGSVRKQIGGLNKDNFDAVLKEVEPFLSNEAGGTFYAKSMRRIGVQAKAFGVSIPDDFAKEAKATKKRRERQDAFIQAKIAEAAEAQADDSEESESDDAESSE